MTQQFLNANEGTVYAILEKKCEEIACKILDDEDVDIDSCDTAQERSRVRAAWRNALSKLGIQVRYVNWEYVNPSRLALPGMMCIGDFTLEKQTAVLDIPNELVERIVSLGRLPDPEPAVRKKPEGPIHRAARNKTQYCNLTAIEPSADNKRLVFNFENGTSFSWCVFDFKFYHTDTGKEFGESHFKNIVWDSLNNKKPGQEGFFDTLESKAKEGWAKNFFYILKKWILNKIQCHGSSVRFSRELNRLGILSNKDVIFPIESLAKNNYVNSMNLENLCKQVIIRGKIVSFQEMKNDNLDNWFFQHVDERVDPKFVRNDNMRHYHDVDIYADDDRRLFILGNYMQNYREFVKKGHGELFRYVWDNFKFPLNMGGWTLENWLQTLKNLNDLGYDSKVLMNYIFEKLPYQGIDQHVNSSQVDLQLIWDYAKMSTDMDRDFDKYPRYLKTAHDVAMKNHRVKKSQILIDKYATIAQNIKHLEYKNEKYSVLVPENLGEIVREGTLLNHCVAQYIEGAVAEKYRILFIRENTDLTKPLVTIEYHNGHVAQAKGYNNRHPTKEEQEFIDEFVSKMNKQKELLAA